MSTLADDRNALPQARAHDPQETEAIRETVAEWMEHQARRVASGAYLADLEDGTSGRNPVLDVCFLALQAAGLAYTVAEAYRDEERTDAASELEEEVGDAVRAVLPPELHDDVVSDAFDAVGERVAGLEDRPGAEPRGVAPGRLRPVRSELRDAREYLGEDADLELAREYVVKGLQRLREAMASALPGSHDDIEPGQFGDDGLFQGHVRCVACGTVEKMDGVEPRRRGPDKALVREHVRGMAGTYLEATCPGCFTAFLAMDDGELAPVMGRRGW